MPRQKTLAIGWAQTPFPLRNWNFSVRNSFRSLWNQTNIFNSKISHERYYNTSNHLIRFTFTNRCTCIMYIYKNEDHNSSRPTSIFVPVMRSKSHTGHVCLKSHSKCRMLAVCFCISDTSLHKILFAPLLKPWSWHN